MQASLERKLFGAQPLRIQRFVVIDRLGAGAMGAVFRAFDPDLDRRVAIKVVKSATGSDEHTRARLVREAQALAKLNHANVVAVHEVGTFEDAVFVAMEYVEGEDLAAWARSNPPSDRKRMRRALDLLRQAGRGLAAAHARGLVHRDVKPANILIGHDGRVKIADFGLALADDRSTDGIGMPGSIEDTDDGSGARDGGSGPGSQRLTQRGATVGTPAYMSPEQQRGVEVDSRADQFSFCVSAWEILFGSRPWDGIPMPDVTPPTPPRDSAVPSHLRAALRTGLSAEPEARFRGMDQLLAVFDRDPGRTRRRIALGLVGTGAAAAAVTGYQVHQAGLCADVDAPIHAVWTVERRTQAAIAFGAVELPYAADSWQRVERGLEQYVARWADISRSTCDATRKRHELGPETEALTMRCLDVRRGELDAFLEVLGSADADIARRAIRATQSLSSLDECADPDRARDTVPVPEPADLADAVTDVRAQIGKAQVWRGSGRAEQAAELLEGLQGRARELGYRPVLAETLAALGGVRETLGDVDGARAALDEAYWLALELRHDTVAVSTSRQLVEHFAHRGQVTDASGWLRTAEALTRRAGDDSTAQAKLESVRSHVLMRSGDLGASEAAAREAVELHPEDGHVRALYLHNVALVLARQGRFGDAIGFQADALNMLEAEFGPDHIELAKSYASLANLYIDLGEPERGTEPATRALELRRATFGEGHPSVASTLQTLGRIAYAERDFEGARARFEEALGIAMDALAPDDPLVLRMRSSLAAAESDLGHHERALELHRQVLTAQQAAQGAQHPATGRAWRNIGWCLLELGRSDEARNALRTADDILSAKLGPSHGLVLDLQGLLARATDQGGDRRAALEILTQAIERARASSDATPELEALEKIRRDIEASRGATR